MRAIAERLKEQRLRGTYSIQTLEKMIEAIVEETKSAVLSQHISNRMRHFDRRTSKDPATVAGEAISHVDKEWQYASRRLLIVPGKQVLATLNTQLQAKVGISITSAQIIRNLTADEVAADLHEILLDLNNFAKGNWKQVKSAA
jgi:hypothetical protein